MSDILRQTPVLDGLYLRKNRVGGSAITNAATISLALRQMQIPWTTCTQVATLTGSTSTLASGEIQVTTGTTPLSTASRQIQTSSFSLQHSVTSPSIAGIDCTKPFALRFLIRHTAATSTGNLRVGLGKAQSDAVGDWVTAGFGIKLANLALSFFRHNGSTYTETSTGASVAGSEATSAITILRTATAFLVYLNGTLVLTDTATGFTTAQQGHFRAEVSNGTDAATMRFNVTPITFIDLQ